MEAANLLEFYNLDDSQSIKQQRLLKKEKKAKPKKSSV